jgi:predicted MFS family arabinose efflux permease
VATVPIPRVEPGSVGARGVRRLVEGFAVIARDRVKTRVVITCAVFSFFSLVFIAWMPVLAERNLGIAPKSAPYGLLFSCFGVGAAAGALSLGTFLSGRDLTRIVRVGFALFAVALTAFALWRTPIPAYPTVVIVGFCYFMAMTSMSTVLQSRLADHDRGKVMAIWIMSFGGVVSLGPLALGPIAEATSITAVILFGGAVAAGLAWYARLDEPEPALAQ